MDSIFDAATKAKKLQKHATRSSSIQLSIPESYKINKDVDINIDEILINSQNRSSFVKVIYKAYFINSITIIISFPSYTINCPN